MDKEKVCAAKMENLEGLIVRGGSFGAGENAVKKWNQSLRKNSQEIAFFGRGALPIWELIPNSVQSDAVRAYYERVLGSIWLTLKRISSQPPMSEQGRSAWPQQKVYVPKEWKVLSGGANVKYFGAGQLLSRSYPIMEDGMPVGWEVESKDHIISDHSQIQAHAIAIWDPDEEWDVKVVTAISEASFRPSVTAILPDGYALVGDGADAQWSLSGNMLVENCPSSKSSWRASSKDHIVYESSKVRAYAIGLRSKRGGAVRTRNMELHFGQGRYPSGSVAATKNSKIVGGGARIEKGAWSWGNMLVDCCPSLDGACFLASGREHVHKSLRVLTVCGI